MFTQLIQSDTPVLVDFYATWCYPCKMMGPILKDVARSVGDKARILKVDVDKNPLAVQKYNIKGVPTLMLFKEGEIVWRQAGVVKAPQLLQVIDNSLV